jgi:UDP:flavonoid glycosyltransferase YjiC (YdhE family)
MERKKVLMATASCDEHFNPLITLALALKEIGYDVRWYTQGNYAPRLAKLQIPHFPFQHVLQFRDGNMNELFPLVTALKNKLTQLNCDTQEFFKNGGLEYYEDLNEIHRIFPYDIMISDLGFTGIPIVRRLMNIPVIGVSTFLLAESAKKLPKDYNYYDLDFLVKKVVDKLSRIPRVEEKQAA